MFHIILKYTLLIRRNLTWNLTIKWKDLVTSRDFSRIFSSANHQPAFVDARTLTTDKQVVMQYWEFQQLCLHISPQLWLCSHWCSSNKEIYKQWIRAAISLSKHTVTWLAGLFVQTTRGANLVSTMVTGWATVDHKGTWFSRPYGLSCLYSTDDEEFLH